MAVNFSDPTCGFSQRKVVDFLNKQILRNGLSAHFYLMQMCESWADMETKLRDILVDPSVSRAMKESCAWRALALAVRLAERQRREEAQQKERLQDQLDEQKLFSTALAGMLDQLRKTQDQEKEKAQAELQESLAILARVQEDCNQLRKELLKMLGAGPPEQPGAGGRNEDQAMQTSGTAAAGAAEAGAQASSGEADAARVSAGTAPTPGWKGKQSSSKKFLQKKFRREPAYSCPRGRTARRHAENWDCEKCHSVNFAWRKKCFKCKNFQFPEESEGSQPSRDR